MTDVYEVWSGDPNDITLEQAKQWLRDRVAKGAACPCCTQTAKVYRRPLNSTMADWLVKAYLVHGRNTFRGPDVVKLQHRGARDAALLRYWGLIEEVSDPKKHGGKTFGKRPMSGIWKITDKGVEFLTGKISVPQSVELYSSNFRGLVGKDVFISTVPKFDLTEATKAVPGATGVL